MPDEQSHQRHRLGDKDLPFKACDGCGAEGVQLFVIDNEALCEECSADV